MSARAGWNLAAAGVAALALMLDKPGTADGAQGVFGLLLAGALAYIGYLERRKL